MELHTSCFLGAGQSWGAGPHTAGTGAVLPRRPGPAHKGPSGIVPRAGPRPGPSAAPCSALHARTLRSQTTGAEETGRADSAHTQFQEDTVSEFRETASSFLEIKVSHAYRVRIVPAPKEVFFTFTETMRENNRTSVRKLYKIRTMTTHSRLLGYRSVNPPKTVFDLISPVTEANHPAAGNMQFCRAGKEKAREKIFQTTAL